MAAMTSKPTKVDLAESGRSSGQLVFSEQHDVELIVLGLRCKEALERAGNQMPLEKFIGGGQGD